MALTPKQDEAAEAIANKLKGEKVTPTSVRIKNLNPRPETPLDISQNLIEPKAGRQTLSPTMADLYKVSQYDKDEAGNVLNKKSVEGWGLYTTITNDTRLSNLSSPNDKQIDELEYVRWATKMEGYCISLGLPNSAWIAKWLTLNVTESSLAKNMALRNIMQTMKQESQHLQVEQSKPSTNLFGFLRRS